MDLEHLSTAPWTKVHRDFTEMLVTPDEAISIECLVNDQISHGCVERASEALADLDFITLAREAFEIMLQRHWGAFVAFDPKHGDRWLVQDEEGYKVVTDEERDAWPDPFTALVEADRWYKENIEKGNKA